MYKYQIIGSFLGTAIGDALGMPVELKTSEYIKEKYGRVTDYIEVEGRSKIKGPCKIGEWTDDTQLMLATAEAMIEAKGFDMDAIAEYHKKAYKESTLGWGGSTRSAVKNIVDGTKWNKATEVDYFSSGSGNGVVMKMLPLAAYCTKEKIFKEVCKMLWNFTSMTHTSTVAQQATYAHYLALKDVFENGKNKFDSATFVNNILQNLKEFSDFAFYAVEKDEDLLKQYERIKDLPIMLDESNDVDQFRRTIGKGGCYVYESIPLVHAMFLTDPMRFECVINAVNYGGDTDSNASMVGGLHGALVGDEQIPKNLIKNLEHKDRILDVANKFWELLNDK